MRISAFLCCPSFCLSCCSINLGGHVLIWFGHDSRCLSCMVLTCGQWCRTYRMAAVSTGHFIFCVSLPHALHRAHTWQDCAGHTGTMSAGSARRPTCARISGRWLTDMIVDSRARVAYEPSIAKWLHDVVRVRTASLLLCRVQHLASVECGPEASKHGCIGPHLMGVLKGEVQSSLPDASPCPRQHQGSNSPFISMRSAI